MPFLFIDSIVPGEHLNALCWTLFHSLWQGLLLAVVAGALVMLTRKQSAALRYNLLLGSFFLFIAGTVTTYIIYVTRYPASDLSQIFIHEPVSMALGEQAPKGHSAQSVYGEVVSFLNRHSAQVVLIWTIVFLFRFLRMYGDLKRLHRLRTEELSSVPDDLRAKLASLATSLGLIKPVSVMQSGLVKVPLVIGHLKPLILLPIGLICALPPEEAEAILLHELSHIRRRDYLVNFVQIGVEMAFFFNLPLLWVSSLIRSERENCCDDTASEYLGDRHLYVRALVSFYERQIPVHGAVALTGSRYQIFQRVKRLIHQRNKNLNIMEKLLLLIGIIATGLVVYAFNTPEQHHPDKEIAAVAPYTSLAVEADTVPSSHKVMNFKGKNGEAYKVVIQDQNVTDIYIDGKKVPANQRGKHLPFINDVRTQLNQALEQAAEAVEQADGALKQAESARALEQAEGALEQAESARVQALENKLNEKQMEQALRDAEKAMEQAQKQAEGARDQYEKMMQRLEQKNNKNEEKILEEKISHNQQEIREAIRDAWAGYHEAMAEIAKINPEEIRREVNEAISELKSSPEFSEEGSRAMRETIAEILSASGEAMKELRLSLEDTRELQKTLKEVELTLKNNAKSLKESQSAQDSRGEKKIDKKESRVERKASRRAEKNSR